MSVDRPSSVRRLDSMIVALSTVLVFGLYLIAAAAQQALLPDRSVSVWHIPAYLAYLALGAVLAGAALTAKAPASIPHRGALAGVGIVALGIVAMFLWSSLFAAENGIGAYVNPPILVIVAGVVLIVSAPWLDTTPPKAGPATWRLQAPAVVSMALTLLVLVWLTAPWHPAVDPLAARDATMKGAGIAADIYRMGADGRNQTRLTRGDQHYSEPAWSPDGRGIVVADWYHHPGAPSDLASDIEVIDVSGGTSQVLLHNGHRNGEPVFSPDGRSIAFSSLWTARAGAGGPGASSPGPGPSDSSASAEPAPEPAPAPLAPPGAAPAPPARPGTQWDVFTMAADGGDVRSVGGALSTDIVTEWTRDGRRLLVHSDRGGAYALYLVDVSTGAAAQLASGPGDATWAQLSPDDQRVVFSSNRSGRFHLYVMSAAGGPVTMLTSGGFDDWVPAWAPDGRRLVFQSNRDGNVEIYAMNSNGTGLTNLSRDAQADDTLGRAPWSPDGTSIVFVRQALAPGASDPQVRGAFGVAAILIQVALAMGVLLVALRRGGLPFGAVALTLALDGVAAGAITGDFRFAIAAAVAGLVGDLLVTGRPRASDPDRRLRRLAFGAVVPAVLVATYLTTIHLTDGVAWSVPLAFGAVLLAALLGLGLAFLVAPLGLAASDRLEGV